MRHVASVAIGLLVIAIGVNCGGAGSSEMSTSTPVPDACLGQTPPPAPAPLSRAKRRFVMKTPIRGLIDLGQVSADDMQVPPPNTLYYACRRQSAISGIVVNDTWSDLQPNSPEQSIDTSAIDAALATVARYNQTPGRALGVRLRIWAGIDAPDWAKSIGGAPIQICDQDAVPTQPQKSTERTTQPQATPTPCPSVAVRTVGRFWSGAYDAPWRRLQAQLAKKYDADPVVNEVSVSSCSSLTSEPFVQPEDGFSQQNLTAAGYTDARYRRCLATAIAHDYEPYWNQTLVDYSFNPFREIDAKPPATDLVFTEATINSCRAAIGNRCVLLNETMGKFTPPPSPQPSSTPSLAADYYAMWNYMKSRGGNLAFQTASPPNLLLAWMTNRAGWDAAVSLAASYGAGSLELFPPKQPGPACATATRKWVAGYTCFSKRLLAKWKGAITTGVNP
jgi:hypothetical protein